MLDMFSEPVRDDLQSFSRLAHMTRVFLKCLKHESIFFLKKIYSHPLHLTFVTQLLTTLLVQNI
jgi:hypothetical protein